MAKRGGPVLFWKPDEKNGWCSNWYPSMFVVDGLQFDCVEQWIMYSKACLFHDDKAAADVMHAVGDPRKQKALGRRVAGFNEDVWLMERDRILQQGLMHKFHQNADLGERLKATMGRRMAEASPSDLIYGIGLRPDDPAAQDEALWRGANALGQCLERVRDELFSPQAKLRAVIEEAEALLSKNEPLEALCKLDLADGMREEGDAVGMERMLRCRIRASGKLEDHEGAFEAAERLIALSTSAVAFQLLGATLVGLKRFDEARVQYEQALERLDQEGGEANTKVRKAVERGLARCDQKGKKAPPESST